MTDEVSLFALMDSHLSKTRLDDENNSVSIKNICLSPLPAKVPIPNFFPGHSNMKHFMAGKIFNTIKNNTIKAGEKWKQEQRKKEEELKKLKIKEKKQLGIVNRMSKLRIQEEVHYIIDLTSAIIPQRKLNQIKIQTQLAKIPRKAQKSKRNRSCIVSKHPLHWDKETCQFKPWDPHLPCLTNFSYKLKQKIKRGKCSCFGKVLCSRVWPGQDVDPPYEYETFSEMLKLNIDIISRC